MKFTISYNSFHRLLKNRTALSTVITTLIILVVSILLASVLTYFAINVVGTRVQEENVYVSKQHVWVDGTHSQAAVMITNNGGRDVVINQIAVRGQTCDLTTMFYSVATTGDDLTTDLSYIATITGGTTHFGGIAATCQAVTGALPITSGETIAIYIPTPDSISINDVGLTVSLAVHSAQAVYYTEANIQAVPA